MKLNKLLISSLTAVALSSSLFAGAHGTHWGYQGHDSSSHWGDLTPEYGTCKKGKNQSPINIVTTKVEHSGHQDKIKFEYVTPATEIVNNGHTVQVNVDAGSSIKIDNEVFLLKQFHFHTPSENQINGKSFPLEVHFVHVSKQNHLAVVGVMFEEGVDNPILREIWEKMPHKVGHKATIFFSSEHINSILPDNREYYKFTGSLTTPPCSENVKWMVMKNYSYISGPEKREFLHNLHHENNRPVQEINGRVISD